MQSCQTSPPARPGCRSPAPCRHHHRSRSRQFCPASILKETAPSGTTINDRKTAPRLHQTLYRIPADKQPFKTNHCVLHKRYYAFIETDLNGINKRLPVGAGRYPVGLLAFPSSECRRRFDHSVANISVLKRPVRLPFRRNHGVRHAPPEVVRKFRFHSARAGRLKSAAVPGQRSTRDFIDTLHHEAALSSAPAGIRLPVIIDLNVAGTIFIQYGVDAERTSTSEIAA